MTERSEPLEIQGRHLHVDCASGAAGDMMLGALIDLGVPVDVIGAALDAIGAGRERLHVHRVVKHGIASVDVKVDTRGALPSGSRHVHEHAQADHAHGHATAQAHGHGHGHEAEPGAGAEVPARDEISGVTR